MNKRNINKRGKVGLIQVYTGGGKGKTTAAVGHVIRSISYGWKVAVVHFHKDPARWSYGEDTILRKLGVKVYYFAKECKLFYKNIVPEKMRTSCYAGIAQVKKMFTQKYDLIVLDEINISIRDGWVSENDVVTLIKTKPHEVELILTGSTISKKIFGIADLVTEMKKHKHPYDNGILSRKGVEY
ncbi:MAG: cob(I)yrinic acid a,c-diamide adenosyltransferase [Elusimicrobiota bacterium]